MVSKVLPDWLKGTKTGAAIVEEYDTSIQEQRKTLVAEIEAIRVEEEQAQPGRAEKLAKARGAVEKAQKALEAAQLVYNQAYREGQGAGYSVTSRVGQLERQLTQSAPSEIDDTISELRDIQEDTRKNYRPTLTGKRENREMHRLEDVVVLDHDAIQARLDCIKVAIQTCEALRFSAHQDIVGELERIKQTIMERIKGAVTG